MYPKFTVLSERAVCMTFGEKPEDKVWQQVHLVNARLEAQPFPGLLATVPAFVTLTVHFDPMQVSGHKSPLSVPAEVVIQQLKKISTSPNAAQAFPTAVFEIPVRYGGAFAPDLGEVAERLQMREATIVQKHADALYQVYLIGFAPGFPYMGMLPAELELPRKKIIRSKVPAGSVAIAGNMTCIYPNESPAGWYVIGQTDLRLFDPFAKTPCLLQAGMRVRFIPQQT